MTGKEFAHFYPIGIRSQVVAGTNFFVKIQELNTSMPRYSDPSLILMRKFKWLSSFLKSLSKNCF